jgi:CRP-like cAMP-binding protein
MSHWPEIRARSFGETVVEAGSVENLLTRDEQEQLCRVATVLNFRRRTVIFSEGEEARFVYLTDKGIIRISRWGASGHRQILAFRVKGDFLGLPDGGRYVNSAETLSAARIYRISWQKMQQVLLSDPKLQLNFLMKVAHELRQAQGRIMTLGQQNTSQRLASFLLDLLRVPELFDEKRLHLKLPINRFDLADYLGSAPESTARAFARLESMGLLRRVTARLIEVLDVEGLQLVQRNPRRCHSAGMISPMIDSTELQRAEFTTLAGSTARQRRRRKSPNRAESAVAALAG